jgi:MraZ protein
VEICGIKWRIPLNISHLFLICGLLSTTLGLIYKMFRGLNLVNLDAKGRLGIPVRFREILSRLELSDLVLTVNPWDRALLLYPLAEWEEIELKLSTLSDFDKVSRRTKLILRGHATECHCDAQGRILIPSELREISDLKKEVVVSGQGNKLEIWASDRWRTECNNLLASNSSEASEALSSLSL